MAKQTVSKQKTNKTVKITVTDKSDLHRLTRKLLTLSVDYVYTFETKDVKSKFLELLTSKSKEYLNNKKITNEKFNSILDLINSLNKTDVKSKPSKAAVKKSDKKPVKKDEPKKVSKASTLKLAPNKVEKPAPVKDKKEIKPEEKHCECKCKNKVKEIEWVKERCGFSCSNKSCMEWSPRRFPYCPFCAGKAKEHDFPKGTR